MKVRGSVSLADQSTRTSRNEGRDVLVLLGPGLFPGLPFAVVRERINCMRGLRTFDVGT